MFNAVHDTKNGPSYYNWAVALQESGTAVAWVNSKKDATLFAAAPDLLEALEELAAECSIQDGETGRPFRVTVELALAAITKAKGGKP